jgi:anti-sigma factor RsiW
MKPVEPAEISALLDGELPPDRANEVRLAIETDPSLRSMYEELLATDADLRDAAVRAMFQPRVAFPSVERSYASYVLLASTILVVLRLAMKLSTTQWATALSIALLAVVVGWLLRQLMQLSDQEHLLLRD